MRKILFKLPFCVTLICLSTFSSWGQIPSSKYVQLVTPKARIEAMKEKFNGFSLKLGYQFSNFLNPIFEENVHIAYNRSFSYYVGARLTSFPFSFDLDYFNDGFKNKSLPGVEIDDKIKHRGFEIQANTVLIPFTKISSILQPNVLFGFRYSQLCLHCIQEENDSDDLELPLSALSTSGLFGGFGLSIPIERISVECEARQSINLKNDISLFQWKIGISIRPHITDY